jgi:hypothetical protein
MLEKDVMELAQQKTNLQFMCMQLHRIMGTHPGHTDKAL